MSIVAAQYSTWRADRILLVMLNSLLALLNSRDSIRDKNRSEPLSIHLSQFGTVSAHEEPPRMSSSIRHGFESKNEVRELLHCTPSATNL